MKGLLRPPQCGRHPLRHLLVVMCCQPRPLRLKQHFAVAFVQQLRKGDNVRRELMTMHVEDVTVVQGGTFQFERSLLLRTTYCTQCLATGRTSDPIQVGAAASAIIGASFPFPTNTQQTITSNHKRAVVGRHTILTVFEERRIIKATRVCLLRCRDEKHYTASISRGPVLWGEASSSFYTTISDPNTSLPSQSMSIA